jgi:hypothetical protein
MVTPGHSPQGAGTKVVMMAAKKAVVKAMRECHELCDDRESGH